MKTFHAILRETSYLELEIEAENREDAMQRAERMVIEGSVRMPGDEANLDVQFEGDDDFHQIFELRPTCRNSKFLIDSSKVMNPMFVRFVWNVER